MILAFADDFSVRVYETMPQIARDCEAIDVENQEYIFLDSRGCVLKPIFAAPIKKKLLWVFSVVDSAPFTFQRTEERRNDLVRQLESGEVRIERGPTGIETLDDLRSAVPSLFAS